MCGIAGEFRFDTRTLDAAAMARMRAKRARHDPSPRSKQRMLDASSGDTEAILRAYVECRAPARYVHVRHLEPRRCFWHATASASKLRLLSHYLDPAGAAGEGGIGTSSTLTVNAHYEHQTPGS